MSTDQVLKKYYGAVAPEREGEIVGPHGNRIWYRVNGEGRPGTPLLIVHGGPGYSHHYLLSLTDLAADRPVYFYDQTDCGHSERVDNRSAWTIDHFVEEIGVVRDALGLDEYFLLGHSWGGTITPPFAAAHPDGLKGLILGSPLISEPRWAADAQALRQALPAETLEMLERHEQAGTRDSAEYQQALEEYANRHFYRQGEWPQDILETFPLINEPMFHSMWSMGDFGADPNSATYGYDGTDCLPQITAPTLVTVGEFDMCTPAAADEFAQLLPAGEAQVFPNSSHSPQYEVRDEYMKALATWMATHDTPR